MIRLRRCEDGYFKQYAQTCFVIACANACIYFGKKITDQFVVDSFKIARCEYGTTIREKDTLDHYGLFWEELDVLPLKCGIIGIAHPEFNLHSLFYFPEFNLVNSLLGTNVMKMQKKDLETYLPDNVMHRRFYTIEGIR